MDQAESWQFHSKEDLVKDFTKERNKSANENLILMQEIKRIIPIEKYLLAVKETYNNVLRIATDDWEQVSQVRIQMDKIGILDKINFNKQASEILYSDLLTYYLNKNMMEAKVIKLEEHIKREKDSF